MPTLSEEQIRALGFEWPRLAILREEAVVTEGGRVDLSSTLTQLQAGIESLRPKVRAAQRFKDDTSADYSEFSDDYDALASRLFDLERGARHVRHILEALGPGGADPSGQTPPARGTRAPRTLPRAWSILHTESWLVLLLIAVVMAGLGALAIWLAIEEATPGLLRPGAVFLGVATAFAIWLAGRGLRALFRRSRRAASRAMPSPVRRRIVIGVAIALACLLAFVLYNWACWYGIQRDCITARDEPDKALARRAFDRAGEAMQDPLLLLPSDLFDLWGPNRCNSARNRFE